MELFRFILPESDICSEPELYFRTSSSFLWEKSVNSSAGQTSRDVIAAAAVNRDVIVTDGAQSEVIYHEETQSISLKKGAVLSFDTYYNSFSYHKYRKYTWVDSVGVRLKLQGEFKVRFIAVRQKEHSAKSAHDKAGAKEYAGLSDNLGLEILQEYIFSNPAVAEFSTSHDFTCDNSEGMLYIELAALSDDAYFYGGAFFAENAEKPVHVNHVKVAFIICTYKREEFVYRNLRTIDSYISASPLTQSPSPSPSLFHSTSTSFTKTPSETTANISSETPFHTCAHSSASSIKDHLHLFIIDNGHTLDPAQVESDYIQVIPNKNYGGSGGFTRGLIEAIGRRNEFTHVLLMDDDIVFEGEVLARTLNLLKVLKPEYRDLFIGAGMLVKDIPYRQHEAGVFWEGLYPKRRKPDLDLRQVENLIINEQEEPLNYSGWWYMCMPLHKIQENSLPLPCFIKADDIEYSIRLAKDILLMNGIGIWHEHFDNKHSPIMEYYLKRNEAILAGIHYPELGAQANIKKLLYGIGKQHLKRQYSTHYFLLQAYQDFLKGIDFLIETDAEKLHSTLMQKNKEPSHDGSLLWFPVLMIKSGLKFLTLAVQLLFGHKTAAESYRKRMNEVTSLDFWCRHLDLKKGNRRGK